MAVTIRLSRRGRHKRPFYRIVVADSKMPRDGRCIEVIGTYDPLAKPAAVQVKKERAEVWLAKGAQVSDTVGSLLRQMGLKRQMKEKKEAMEIS